MKLALCCKISLCCLMAAVLGAVPAVASPLGYTFTATNLLLNPPSGPIDNVAIFTLAAGQAPSSTSYTPPNWALTYTAVPMTWEQTNNGTVITNVNTTATLTFYYDGIQVTTPQVSFFAGSSTGVWTGSPTSPTFVPGLYASVDRLGDSVQVAPALAATPEPASLTLLGTGLLGMVGVVRRRRAACGSRV